MSDHHAKLDHDDDRSLSEEMGFEVRDMDTAMAGKAAVWFFVFIGVSLALAAGSMIAIRAFEGPSGATEEFRRLPEQPNPLLQSNATAWQDMVNLMAKEKAGLKAEGDEPVFEIPIDEAMKQVAEGPTKTSAAPAPAPQSSEEGS